MKEIYVLLEEKFDPYYNSEWIIVGFTENPITAGNWRRSSTMYVKRKDELTKEYK